MMLLKSQPKWTHQHTHSICPESSYRICRLACCFIFSNELRSCKDNKTHANRCGKSRRSKSIQKVSKATTEFVPLCGNVDVAIEVIFKWGCVADKRQLEFICTSRQRVQIDVDTTRVSDRTHAQRCYRHTATDVRAARVCNNKYINQCGLGELNDVLHQQCNVRAVHVAVLLYWVLCFVRRLNMDADKGCGWGMFIDYPLRTLPHNGWSPTNGKLLICLIHSDLDDVPAFRISGTKTMRTRCITNPLTHTLNVCVPIILIELMTSRTFWYDYRQWTMSDKAGAYTRQTHSSNVDVAATEAIQFTNSEHLE